MLRGIAPRHQQTEIQSQFVEKQQQLIVHS
jgi:hypothetical protein